MAINVLYIQHCGIYGGSSRSLLELINALREDKVIANVIIPKGSSQNAFRSKRISILSAVGIAQYDYYKGMRWLAILREIFYILPTIYILIVAKFKWKKIDIIHINDWTLLLPVIITKWLFKKPIVLHARCLNFSKNTSIYNRVLEHYYTKCVDILIPIDQSVSSSLNFLKIRREVIHNGFSPLFSSDESFQYTVPARKLTVAMVGNFLKIKGHIEFIKTAKIICIDKNLDVNFLLAGDNPREPNFILKYILGAFGMYEDLKKEMKFIVKTNKLENNVHFLGTVMNIEKIYSNINVLCFPSYFDAIGRPVFEAGFLKVPSIVAIENPLDDTIIDGVTGICIRREDSEALANAIEYFYNNPNLVKEMGEKAYELANRNFDIKKNAHRMLKIYQELMG